MDDKIRCSTTSEQNAQPSVARLIAWLKQATVPNPYLDAEIEAAIKGGIPAYRCYWDVKEQPSAVRSADQAGASWYCAPSFTGSLDVALTLVPEGHRWLLDKRPSDRWRQDGYRAEVHREAHPYLSDRSDMPMHWGPTPALALCIAALKARQVSPQTVARTPSETPNTEAQPNTSAVADPEPGR